MYVYYSAAVDSSVNERRSEAMIAHMIAKLSAVTIASLITVADKAPTFNVEPSCRFAASGELGIVQDKTACMRSEDDAHAQIEAGWNLFNAGDRRSCVTVSTMGGLPTYTELLTCLEMYRDVRKLHAEGGADVTSPQADVTSPKADVTSPKRKR